jgi:cobalt-precorrin-5B (C1)-methyltransferase
MGDFVGGMLKYLRRHDVPRITIAGGIGKMTKLGQGLLDLHSKRGAIDRLWLGREAAALGASQILVDSIESSNTAALAFEMALGQGIDLGARVAAAARATAAACLGRSAGLDIVIFDRDGRLVGRAG